MFLSPYLATYFAKLATVRAICFAVWTAMGPGHATHDANEIADSIATAVMEEKAPVFGSAEEDAAILAYWARAESGLSRSPRPQSWDARGGVSCDVWQQRCSSLAPTLLGQARAEVELMRRGTVLCPEQPMAPLSGGCHGAGRRLADRRVESVRAALAGMAE